MEIVRVSGSFKKTVSYLGKLSSYNPMPILRKYGQIGIERLRENTPSDTGETASKWHYNAYFFKNKSTIYWYNDNIENGVPVIILLVYGHATKNKGYISGTDFVNPVIKEIFDKIELDIIEEIRSL
jgi:hypothetical protein